MLDKLLGKRTASMRLRIDSVVDGHLAIVMVEPAVNVLAALFHNLLTQHDGAGRGRREKVVLWHNALFDSGATVVAEMEDARLDAKP